MPQGEVVIDPFTGQSLSRDELNELLAPYKRDRGLQGDFDVPLGLFLQAATAREVLARMLRNLKEIHRGSADVTRLLAVLQRLVVLLPQIWEERRDRGIVYAELGDDAAATRDLTLYLENVPDAQDRQAIAERLAHLGRTGSSSPPRLH
jgi:regulator of sirC expression with transglutaminase-like and TPR domain